MTLIEALEYIAKNKYGLQCIEEDYGYDTNAFNYRAYKYYEQLAHTYQDVAKLALLEIKREDNAS